MAITKAELDRFYSEIEIPIYNFALRWTWNPALAEELVHDAFIRVWRHRDQVDASTLKGLLYKTVQNLALNERRRFRLREALPILNWMGDQKVSGAESKFIENENLAELQNALEALTSDLRETLLMCQFSDMSYEEMGQALGISAGTVGSRKSRALAELKTQLARSQSSLGNSYGK